MKFLMNLAVNKVKAAVKDYLADLRKKMDLDGDGIDFVDELEVALKKGFDSAHKLVESVDLETLNLVIKLAGEVAQLVAKVVKQDAAKPALDELIAAVKDAARLIKAILEVVLKKDADA